jgi:phosphosulfolactate synthase (CoM biosynthesis protein A)
MEEHRLFTDCITFPVTRSEKPRENGLTWFIDWGMSLDYLEGMLVSSGAFLDIAKLPGLALRLQPAEYLRKKITLYAKHGIRVFGGGMMLEAALICRKAEQFLDEARELGITVVEVSESESRMVPATKLRLVQMAKERGFDVTAELGPHGAEQPYSPREVIRCGREYLSAGAWKIILEADVISFMKPWENAESAESLATIIDELGFRNIIFELSENIRMAQWFVLNYGPEVNLALNQGAVAQIPEGVMKLEHIRRGVLFPGTWFGDIASL